LIKNGLGEPSVYLSQVIKALPYAATVEKIEALLPWNINNTNFLDRDGTCFIERWRKTNHPLAKIAPSLRFWRLSS